MKIKIEDYIIDKFKEFLKSEGLETDITTIQDKLNKFIEQNLDLII